MISVALMTESRWRVFFFFSQERPWSAAWWDIGQSPRALRWHLPLVNFACLFIPPMMAIPPSFHFISRLSVCFYYPSTPEWPLVFQRSLISCAGLKAVVRQERSETPFGQRSLFCAFWDLFVTKIWQKQLDLRWFQRKFWYLGQMSPKWYRLEFNHGSLEKQGSEVKLNLTCDISQYHETPQSLAKR